MSQGFTSADFHKMGMVKQPDGSYTRNLSKPSLEPIPLSKIKKAIKEADSTEKFLRTASSGEMRTIELRLYGIPLAKQSARHAVKNGKIISYQPTKFGDRKKDYIRQILGQLPDGFVPFEKRVHSLKFHCIYPPLKNFSKATIESINRGEIVWKESQPDIIDNLKKLVFDSMADIVYTNDGKIVSEDNVKKYYGKVGMILITLKGS